MSFYKHETRDVEGLSYSEDSPGLTLQEASPSGGLGPEQASHHCGDESSEETGGGADFTPERGGCSCLRFCTWFNEVPCDEIITFRLTALGVFMGRFTCATY